MLGLATSGAATASCPHVVRQQAQAGQLAGIGRPAAAASCPPRRQRRRGAVRSPSSIAASALDATAAAAAAAAGWASSDRGAADSAQPPSSSGGGQDAASSSGNGGSGGDGEDLQGETFAYLQHCQQEFGKPGLIEFSEGVNKLPKVTMQHPGGARCELYLHGSTITSWRHTDGREMLHLREGNAFNGSDAIDGGIQVAWPQYGAGALPTHGFLQNLHWSVVETCWREPDAEQPAAATDADTIMDWRPTISLYADTDEEWAEAWPHKFEALYTITLMQPDPPKQSDAAIMRQAAQRYQPWKQRQEAAAAAARAAAAATEGRRWGSNVAGSAPIPQMQEEEATPVATPSVLRCLLQLHNSDEVPFTFTTGLRSHFATQDITIYDKFVKTLGLNGKYTLDYSRNPFKPRLGVEDADHMFFGDMTPKEKVFVDCDEQGDIMFCPGIPAHFHIANKQGFSDIVVTHPASVAPQEARHFVALSSARAVRKVTLQPGEVWVGEMVLTAHDRYWALPAWELDDPSGVPIPERSADMLPVRRLNPLEADRDPDA